MASTLLSTKTPFESMTSWFDHDFFANDFETNLTTERNIKTKEETYVIKTGMPGLKKKDIHLELRNGMLTLRGELRSRNEKTTGRHTKVERSFGSVERKFMIPKGVTKKDIHAKYTDGMLELTIPVPKD